MTRRTPGLVWVVLVGSAASMVAASCTGGEETAATTTTGVVITTAPPAPTTTAPSAVEAYFGGLAAGVSGNEPPVGSVAGSDAAWYAAHRSRVSALLGRAGQPTVESLPDAVGLCTADCVRFTAIQSDPATGEIITFAVDDAPLAGRIAAGGEPSTIDGVTLSISSAYANDEGLTVVVEIDNTSAVDFQPFGFAATWLPSDGVDATEATGTWGSAVVPAGSSGEVLVTFEPSAPTGELAITGLRGDGFDAEFRLPAGPT